MRHLGIIFGGALFAAVLTSAAFAQDAAAPKSANIEPTGNTSEDVVIAPQQKRATPPDGDPRSAGERRADQVAYGRCMLHAQNNFDMAHPVDATPQEYCKAHLGMSSKNDIPDSVRLRGPQ